MRFIGNVYREGRFWLAEVPLFAAMSQGRTRKEALAMIRDWFVSMANQPGFDLSVIETSRDRFEISSPDTRTLIRLLLQRRRESSGLSLAEVARRMGARSRNAYARYEQGRAVPSLEKLDELLRAVGPESEFVIQETSARYPAPHPERAKD